MPYKRRSGVEKTLLKFVKWIGITAAVILVVLAISLLIKSLLTKEKMASTEPPIQIAQAEIEEPDASSEIKGKYYGLCMKNSIFTVEDFRKTVLKDATLSAHFAGFNWGSAKLGKLDDAIWTFVSFRKGEVIRRTSKPVRLPKGDGYITDGIRTVRTFCCNDYVIAPPPMEVSMADPVKPIERVDGPPRRMNKAVERTDHMSAGSPAEVSVGSIPEILTKVDTGPYNYSPPIFSNHSGHGDNPNPNVVPEPGTAFLMGSGVAAIVFLRLLRRKQNSGE